MALELYTFSVGMNSLRNTVRSLFLQISLSSNILPSYQCVLILLITMFSFCLNTVKYCSFDPFRIKLPLRKRVHCDQCNYSLDSMMYCTSYFLFDSVMPLIQNSVCMYKMQQLALRSFTGNCKKLKNNTLPQTKRSFETNMWLYIDKNKKKIWFWLCVLF